MEQRDGPCNGCGRHETLALFEDGWLCYDCWHTAREATPPYHVRSRSNPARYSHAALVPMVYTHAEAVQQARKMGEDFEPVPAPSWVGERLAHPGYMGRRRAAIVAGHPEYK